MEKLQNKSVSHFYESGKQNMIFIQSLDEDNHKTMQVRRDLIKSSAPAQSNLKWPQLVIEMGETQHLDLHFENVLFHKIKIIIEF